MLAGIFLAKKILSYYNCYSGFEEGEWYGCETIGRVRIVADLPGSP